MHEYIVLHIPSEWKANARLFFFIGHNMCTYSICSSVSIVLINYWYYKPYDRISNINFVSK